MVWNGYALIDEVIRALDKQPSAYEGAGPLLISKGHNLGALGVNWAYPNAGKDDSKVVADYKKIWGIS